MAGIKLYYFDMRGRAELIRLVLALAGQEFEDVRVSREEWPKYKAEAPFGQIPYADIRGQKYGQSNALAYYFARDKGLYGKTIQDALRIDEVIGINDDILHTVAKAHYESDETKKAEMNKKLMDEDLPRFFGFFVNLLKKNSPNGVFVGKDLTLADLAVFDKMYSVLKFKGYDAAAAYPELKALKDKVENNPRIKAYLAKRIETEF